MAAEILTPTNLTAFLVAESTLGVPVFPSSGDSIQLRSGIAMPTQPTTHSRLPVVANTGSVPSLMLDLRPAGTFRLPFYLQPSGSAGTPPQEGPILKALCGSEVASTAVTYSLTADQDSYTLWFALNNSNTVIGAAGAVINGLTLREGVNGGCEAEASGQFLRLIWCGESTLNGAVLTGAATIVVTDCTQFGVGAFLDVGGDDNGGAGYRVATIATGTHTLTITPVMQTAQGNLDPVIPCALPSPTLTGQPIDTRPVVKIDSAAVNWSDWSVEFNRDVTAYAEVDSDPSISDFPVGYTAGTRNVTGTVNAILRTNLVSRLRAARADGTLDVDWTARAAGDKLLIALPQGRWNVGESEFSDPTLRIGSRFDARSSAALEDEISFVYS